MKTYEVAMAVTGEIPFFQEAESPEEAANLALKEANKQFPGALKIEITTIKEF